MVTLMKGVYMNIKKITICIFLLASLISLPNLSHGANNTKLTIFYAANLISAINDLTSEFKKLYPDIEIIAESSGSLLAVKKVTELNRHADMIFVADYKLINDMLMPEHANWGILLYRDPIVIAFTHTSRYTDEINSENWYKILSRDDVQYGYANPNLAPVGYRTLMAWQLADLYYKEKINGKNILETLKAKCPEDYMRPDVSELTSMLESISLDYVFLYKSNAQQHNLKFIELPEEINLGNEKFEDLYKKASVSITNKKGEEKIINGRAVVFAFTILNDAKNKKTSIDFARLLLGEIGQAIMKRNFQTLSLPLESVNIENIPGPLKEYILY